MKICYLDFEFYDSRQPTLELVSCALMYRDRSGSSPMKFRVKTFWLLNDEGAQKKLARLLETLLRESYLFCAYAFTAEARCILQLCPSVRPKDLSRAVDLYLEYRMLLNHDHDFAYGKQLLNGKVRYTVPPRPKWERTEEEEIKGQSQQPQYGLGAACYKLLGVKIDSERKTRVRDIIISGDVDAIESARDEILAYNLSDIEHLRGLLKRFAAHYRSLGTSLKSFLAGASSRAEYAARTAEMERLGYPINVKWLGRFEKNIRNIINEAADQCREEAPEVKAWLMDVKRGVYSVKQAPIQEWIKEEGLESVWPKTDTGKLSLSVDAFGKHFDSSSGGFGGAFVRYLKTKQSLNGFGPQRAGKKTFRDHLGDDGRARPYFGIYGSQSARSQPGATGFIPLKAHWLRAFIVPRSGRAIVSIDFSSQEFLIAALLSEDRRMLRAYQSGDPYIAFGKDGRLLPKSATKITHGREREKLKGTVLGVQYEMGDKTLARRQGISVEEAASLIRTFYDTYPDYADWKKETLAEYRREKFLSLADGWTMWGDNDNHRSVGNFPIQGMGSAIMRKSVAIAQDWRLDVIFTLHDALYIECDLDRVEEGVQALASAMDRGFRYYFPDHQKPDATVRLEAFAWGRGVEEIAGGNIGYWDYRDDDLKMPLETSRYYIDSKGRKDFERYSKFFMKKG